MIQQAQLPKKHLYWILFSCASIVLAASLEVSFVVKDQTLYESWLNAMSQHDQAPARLDFNTYVSFNLMLYFSKLIVPCAYALFSYWTWRCSRVSYLFVFIWAVLTAGNLAYAALGSGLTSVFTYIYLVAHGSLLVATLTLTSQIRLAALR